MKYETIMKNLILSLLLTAAAAPRSWAGFDIDAPCFGVSSAEACVAFQAQSKAIRTADSYKAKTRELLKRGLPQDHANNHSNEGLRIQSVECGNFERAWQPLSGNDKSEFRRTAETARAACGEVKKGQGYFASFSKEIQWARANPYQRDIIKRKAVAMARLKRVGEWSGLNKKDIASLNLVYGSIFGAEVTPAIQAIQKDNMRNIQGKLQGSKNYSRYHQQTIEIRRAQNAKDWARADQLQNQLFEGMAPKDKRRIQSNIKIAGSAAGVHGLSAAAQSRNFKGAFKETRRSLFKDGAGIKEVRRDLYKGSLAPDTRKEVVERKKSNAGRIAVALALLASMGGFVLSSVTANPILFGISVLTIAWILQATLGKKDELRKR